ncbi:MAG: nucleotide exchange factor GrpE [Thermoprotei archaeon]
MESVQRSHRLDASPTQTKVSNLNLNIDFCRITLSTTMSSATQPTDKKVEEQAKVQRQDSKTAANSLDSELEKERSLRSELETRLKYLQADYQNLVKRTAREIEEFKVRADERYSILFIDLIETVESALTMVRGKADPAVVQGIELIQRKLEEILKASGVSKIEALGKVFDPYYHEAVQTVESDKPEGTVIEEVRAGYILNGRVLRPSMVKVSKKKVEVKNENG